MFKLNLGYILRKALNFDKQDNTLYKALYQKLINTLQNDNFLTADSRDKLQGFIPKKTAFDYWWIKINV